MEQANLWPENSLPVPFALVCEATAPVEEVVIVEDDNFPKGRVSRYFPNQGYGFIEDRSGREVVFSLDEVEIVGKKSSDALKPGIAVGYDLSQAGRILHVKKLKIY